MVNDFDFPEFNNITVAANSNTWQYNSNKEDIDSASFLSGFVDFFSAFSNISKY